MLIVIAILAVIAALLFPVITSAKASAKQANCAAEKHQIGLATSLYLADYDGSFPSLTSAFVSSSNPLPARTLYFSWMLGIGPFARDPLIYRCPSAVNNDRIFPFVVDGQEVLLPERQTGFNQFVAPDAESADFRGAINESVVGQPSLLPIIADSAYVDFDSPDYIILANYDSPLLDADSGAFESAPNLATMRTDPNLARHNGGSTIIFADSHTKWRSQGSMGPDPSRSSYPFAQSFLLPVDVADNRITP